MLIIESDATSENGEKPGSDRRLLESQAEQQLHNLFLFVWNMRGTISPKSNHTGQGPLVVVLCRLT